MHISDAGLAFIESQEGFVAHPYWDPYGRVWTRGFGETEGITARSPSITRAQASANLRRRIETHYEWAIRDLGVDFTQVPGGQQKWDVLCSFAWNLGAGIFTGSLRHALQLKLWQNAAQQMLAYDHAGGVVLPGLKRRRELEAAGLVATAPEPYVPPDEKRWREQYDQLAHRRGPWASMRRRVLRRVMTRRRKLIRELAQKTGWGKLDRKERYYALLARTE